MPKKSKSLQLGTANKTTGKTVYTDEDKFIALAAVHLNAGNVYRTAIALGIAETTLRRWCEERDEHPERFAAGVAEKRGDLATKMESVAHSIVESMPQKIEGATLSQSAVALGILTDKAQNLRRQMLEPDPTAELCRILGINRNEIPDTLTLAPGEELPADLLQELGIIETQLVRSARTLGPPGSSLLNNHAEDCKARELSDFIDDPATAELRIHNSCSCPLSSTSRKYHHPDFGILGPAKNQSGLPSVYIRVTDGFGNLLTLRASELSEVPAESTDDDLLNAISDDSTTAN